MARADGQTHISPGGATMAARVLIVDDEVDSCWLVAFVLRQDPNLALAGEATDGEMAVSLIRQERPDVVVMDVMMPRLGGLEAIRRIKREWPDTKGLVLTHLTGDATRPEASESVSRRRAGPQSPPPRAASRAGYLGSLAARTSPFSMAGGFARSSRAFCMSAAATRPERWACRPASSGNASKMPKVLGPSRSANQ